MNRMDVMVIGAGPAGLGCAAELQRVGRSAVVLDQANAVASSWRGRYDRLRLNTSKWFSKLPGARYPPGTGLFPSRDDMVRYLEEYVKRQALDVRLGTRVHRVDPDGDAWAVRTSGGELHASHVVIATGLYRKPILPEWPGRARYRGRLIHSSQYLNPEPFHGQAVLVVGPGSSGMEIAYDLLEAGIPSVKLSVRSPPNILLRSIGGLPGDPAAMLLLRFPPRLADALMGGMGRLTVGDLSEYGLPRPREGPFQRMRRDGAAPTIIDKEVLDAIRARRIEVVAGVESLDESGVRLGDGSRLEVDAVIAATGYRPGLEELVGHLNVLDEHGMPRPSTGEEAAPGLRFIGFRPVPGLIGDAAAQARRMARSIARDRRVPAPRPPSAPRASRAMGLRPQEG